LVIAGAAVPAGAAFLLSFASLLLALVALFAVPAASAASASPDSSAAPGAPDWLSPATGRGSGETGSFFAVVAFDSASGSWGVACAGAEIACGARIPAAAAGAGAIASLGPGTSVLRAVLATLATGISADSALALLRAAPEDPAARQSVVIAANGRAAAYSGSRLPGFSGTLTGPAFGCAGFGLRSQGTLDAMEAAFFGRAVAGRVARTTGVGVVGPAAGELGARLLAALEAGERAEGDPFGRRGMDASAALLVVRAGAAPAAGSDRLVDLRVDEGDDPVGTLGRLYARHAETFLPAAHVRFGDAARRRGDDAASRREYALAEAGFRAAVARAPKDGGALNELAWFLATRGGDSAEALRFAEAAASARADDPNILDTVAEAAYRAGDLERAVQAAERAARLARGNARYAERLRAFRAARAALASPSR
jgi:uncharacterized Ntn-hydrolase superfamily protein